MHLHELTKRAEIIKHKYDALNAKNGTSKWDAQQFMAGFVGDVGDLSKLILAKQGYRNIDDTDIKLAHELSDCLWSILVIASQYGIDLETEFLKTMDLLDKKIKDL